MKKIKFKTEGLTGDALTFAQELNRVFGEMPESVSKEDVTQIMQDTFKGLFGEDGKPNITLFENAQKFGDELNVEKEGTIKNILKKQGDQLTNITRQMQRETVENGWDEFKKDFTSDEAKKELATIKRNRSNTKTFTIKEADVTTTASSIINSVSTATASRLGTGPVYNMQRPTPFILDFVSVGQTNLAAFIWFDEVQKEGDFAITAEGAAKPLVQYIFERKSADYKKAAGYTVITEEFDMDYPSVVSRIRQLMQIDCRNKITEIIVGDMVANAGTYAYNGLDGAIEDPDNYAAIGAAIAQLQNLYYTPNILILNPADAWLMKLQKDTTGQWVMPPFEWNGRSYEFGTVLVDPRVPAGNFFIGDASVYQVWMRGDIIVRIGYINEQFINNEYSMVVEQFFYSFITSARKAGFIYANFGAVKEDIAAA